MKSLSLVCLVLIGFVSGFAAEPGKPAGPKPELPKTGINLARDGGGWINVVVIDLSFVVSFFNDLQMPVAADVQHGLVRYDHAAKGEDQTPLNPSADGKTLVSPGNVEHPLIFRVHMALFDEGPDDLAETYAFSYAQD